MFKINWMLLLAVGGFLAICLWLIWANEPATPSITENEAETDQPTGHYDGAVTCNANCQVTFGLSNRNAAEKQDEPQPDANGSNNIPSALTSTDADLLAQERMAYWTRWIGVFTAIGLAALYLTLDATNRTASAYLNAERAWISNTGATSHKIVDFNTGSIEGIAIAFDITNTGPTPAINVRINCATPLVDKGTPIDTIRLSNSKANENAAGLGPGDHASTNRLSFRSADVRDIIEGRKDLYIAISVRYFDVFSPKERETEIFKQVLINADWQTFINPDTSMQSILQLMTVGQRNRFT